MQDKLKEFLKKSAGEKWNSLDPTEQDQATTALRYFAAQYQLASGTINTLRHYQDSPTKQGILERRLLSAQQLADQTHDLIVSILPVELGSTLGQKIIEDAKHSIDSGQTIVDEGQDYALRGKLDFAAELMREESNTYAKRYKLSHPHLLLDHLPKHTSLAHRLIQGKIFDIAVGVAREALSYSCLFEKLGAPVLNVLVKEEKDREYSELDDLAKIKGKRILILEDDVVSGKTVKIVTKELKKYKPKSMQLYIGDMRTNEVSGLHWELLNKLFTRTYLAEEEKPANMHEALDALLRQHLLTHPHTQRPII